MNIYKETLTFKHENYSISIEKLTYHSRECEYSIRLFLSDGKGGSTKIDLIEGSSLPVMLKSLKEIILEIQTRELPLKKQMEQIGSPWKNVEKEN